MTFLKLKRKKVYASNFKKRLSWFWIIFLIRFIFFLKMIKKYVM